ncbi:hypothetical protein VPNG_05945 [Cytospora leucostoma]|uniref:RRM domain-containing protein n=1 Tax=Cytospora leucostoma TaxID=1230097 RepID=A0A423XAX9_9PEZI|nr:hypothetical protein VPNG_05945 [Cytospora leucostoma]
MAKDKQVATDFQKLITEGRERKQAQELAAKIFRKDRVQSAPQRSNGASGSLASRVGVKKRVSSAAAPKPGSLAARIHAPGTPPPSAATGPRAQRRQESRQNALLRAEHDSSVAAQVNLVSGNRNNNAGAGRRRGGGFQQGAVPAPSAPVANGMTIRGLAGPYVVLAQNFAPGTTAADIESAMVLVGGLILKCRILKTHPITIAEIEFETKEGADRVIESFNNQLADGRVLHVFHKLGGSTPPTGPAPRTQPKTQKENNGIVVDGSLGFEPMQIEGGSNTGLYSDRLDRDESHDAQNSTRRDRFDRDGDHDKEWGWKHPSYEQTTEDWGFEL